MDTSNTIMDTCAISVTPNQQPYIDRVCPNLYVACGGNGWAAKSADELGRLAAELFMEKDEVQSEKAMLGGFPKEKFKCKYLDKERMDYPKGFISKI